MKNAVIAAIVAAIVASPVGYTIGRDSAGINARTLEIRVLELEHKTSELRQMYNDDAVLVTELDCRHEGTRHANADEYNRCMWGNP